MTKKEDDKPNISNAAEGPPAMEPFERLAVLAALRKKKMQMEKLIGQLCTTKEDKSYLATSMRQVGDDYLFLMLPLDKSHEPFVGSFQYEDDKLIMFEYIKSDRDEILSEFMNNALNDLQTIRTKLWMNEAEQQVP